MRNLIVLAMLPVAPALHAQVPVIAGQGRQNAGTNSPLTTIAPQTLITIKGQNLATSTEAASGYPLPTEPGGAPARWVYLRKTTPAADMPSRSTSMPAAPP